MRDELVLRAQAGDRNAADEIVRELYDDAIRLARGSGYYAADGDQDDVDQEALFGLLRAIRFYKPDAGLAFRPYALMCVRRWLIWAVIRRPQTERSRVLSQAVRVLRNDDDEEVAAVELAADPRSDVVQLLADREELQRIGRGIRRLSPFEADCIRGITLGLSYAEIGDPDRVDNAMWRARRRLRFHLQEAA